ncbi:MAG: ABC transporter permease [Actinomycetes bacterium]|jgi:teichoic acid transport system permease protein|nr:ABC transporter permease [Actinomycetes bacterium]
MIIRLIQTLRGLVRDTWGNRAITWELAKRDLHKKYKGAALGVLWAGAHPITYVCVYWFAVSIGLRGGRSETNGFPYILWLIPGMFAWQTISSAFSEGGNSIRSHRELVTKTVFPLITIPQFSIISLFFVHVGLMVFALALFLVLGYPPTMYWLQLPYYMAASFIFCVVVATFFSALTAYSRDLVQFIRTLTQILFWFTPILWPITNVSGTLASILKLNPIVYLVEGYRASMIYQTWFFQKPMWTLYFWVATAAFALVTVVVWTRMSKDFADVL